MTRLGPLRTGVLLSLVLALAIPHAATAIEWSLPFAMTESGDGAASVNATGVYGNRRAFVAYRELVNGQPAAMFRRSADAGVTWGLPVQISQPEAHHVYAVALNRSWEANVDVVIGEEDASGHRVLWYRRSQNLGADWDPPVQLTPELGNAGVGDVTRHRDRVTLVYTDRATGSVYVRRSRNEGVSFGQPILVGQTTNRPDPDAPTAREGYPVLVDEQDRIHVAWQASDNTLKTKRSTKIGFTFGAATVLSKRSDGGLVTIMSDVKLVRVGFTSMPDGLPRATLRRSGNYGETYKPAELIGGPNSFVPTFLEDFITRAVYTQCVVADCSQQAVFFRNRGYGETTWGGPIRATPPMHAPRAVLADVISTEYKKFMVLYVHEDASGDTTIYARSRL